MGHVKRLFMLAYLIGFALVNATTALFTQYPLLKWLGLLGVLAVFVDTGRCARRHWRTLREEGISLSP
ncbi:hypothetical protein ACFR9U_10830 [Halorientalis brevis]|uniref:Uncharacterized protein n=1 Tax=Halorientalis brevis TaxID=1126241 RepID=A0ABD6CBT4_9EURY|nr:hypothetical protein [Halorientalis brevis]